MPKLIEKPKEDSPRSRGGLLERLFATYNDVDAEEAKKRKDLYGFHFKLEDYVEYNAKYPNYLNISKTDNLAIIDSSNDFWFKSKAIYMTSNGEINGYLQLKSDTLVFDQ